MSAAVPLQKQASKSPPVTGSSHAGLLLQRKCACGSSTASLTGTCTECNSKNFLQTKLAIGAINDPLEQEADRVADQVLSAPSNPVIGGETPRIQRFTGHTTGDNGTAPASVDRVLASPGMPLEPALRHDMEQRFGHDFSRVLVHSDGAAEQSARDVNANAYTVRHNIVFGAGQPAPGSRDGRKLLAHELTHVVQQRAGHVRGMQRDAGPSESLPKKAKVITLEVMGHFAYDFGRPITKEQAAYVLFRDGKVPTEAKLVPGPGKNSWTVQTAGGAAQQATVNKMRARTETVSPGKPTEPPVPGQWNPPPPDEVTVEWTDGPTKPSTGPERRDLKNDLGFKITKNYPLDEGQSPARHVKSGLGFGKGHGYELVFDMPVTKAQVMDTLFGKNDLGEGTVKLMPVTPEPATKWQVHVIGVDALTAFKRAVFRAMADASVYAGESISPDIPKGVRAHIENKTVPTDATKHPPNVFVWEQEGHLVRVETDGRGKKGYYTYETTKLDHADEASKTTMRYFMMEQGMPPRKAWQEYIKHWDDIHRQVLGAMPSGGMPGKPPRSGMAGAPRRLSIKKSTPTNVPPTPPSRQLVAGPPTTASPSRQLVAGPPTTASPSRQLAAGPPTTASPSRQLPAAPLPAALRPVDILMPGGSPIGRPGVGRGNRRLNGGLPAAQKMFDQLSAGGKDVTPKGYPGKLVDLPNGGRVGLRPVSSSPDRSPSLDVNIPGVKVNKIHFEP